MSAGGAAQVLTEVQRVATDLQTVRADMTAANLQNSQVLSAILIKMTTIEASLAELRLGAKTGTVVGSADGTEKKIQYKTVVKNYLYDADLHDKIPQEVRDRWMAKFIADVCINDNERRLFTDNLQSHRGQTTPRDSNTMGGYYTTNDKNRFALIKKFCEEMKAEFDQYPVKMTKTGAPAPKPAPSTPVDNATLDLLKKETAGSIGVANAPTNSTQVYDFDS